MILQLQSMHQTALHELKINSTNLYNATTVTTKIVNCDDRFTVWQIYCTADSHCALIKTEELQLFL